MLFAIRFFLNKNIKTVGGREYIKYVKKFSKTDYLAKISSESHERIIESNNINVIANIENKLIQDL